MADIGVDFDKVGLLAVRDGKILLCRKKHATSLLILPGGAVSLANLPWSAWLANCAKSWETWA